MRFRTLLIALGALVTAGLAFALSRPPAPPPPEPGAEPVVFDLTPVCIGRIMLPVPAGFTRVTEGVPLPSISDVTPHRLTRAPGAELDDVVALRRATLGAMRPRPGQDSAILFDQPVAGGHGFVYDYREQSARLAELIVLRGEAAFRLTYPTFDDFDGAFAVLSPFGEVVVARANGAVPDRAAFCFDGGALVLPPQPREQAEASFHAGAGRNTPKLGIQYSSVPYTGTVPISSFNTMAEAVAEAQPMGALLAGQPSLFLSVLAGPETGFWFSANPADWDETATADTPSPHVWLRLFAQGDRQNPVAFDPPYDEAGLGALWEAIRLGARSVPGTFE
ncbi:MAG: hypothetical protein AAGK98_06020 [Pseudomonadota bacterium]